MDALALTLRTSPNAMPEFAQDLMWFVQSIDLSAPHRFRLNLILEELVSNTVHHGLAQAANHTIRVELRRQADGVEVTLTDDAPPFNPFGRSSTVAETPLEDRPIGGLGLHLVEAFAINKRYRRDGNRNVVDFTLPL